MLIVRRPGNFPRLLKNLAFIKGLREAGDIERLEVSMVVQALNYREMPAFVRLGRSLGADEIAFEMIHDWGVYTPAEFAEVYVGPNHPELGDLIAVMQAPEMSDPRVAAGAISAHIAQTPARQGRLKRSQTSPQPC